MRVCIRSGQKAASSLGRKSAKAILPKLTATRLPDCFTDMVGDRKRDVNNYFIVRHWFYFLFTKFSSSPVCRIFSNELVAISLVSFNAESVLKALEALEQY